MVPRTVPSRRLYFHWKDHQTRTFPSCKLFTTSAQLDMAESEGSTPNRMCETTTQCSFPSFVKTVRSFNMHSGALELPATFVKEHGLNFQKLVTLQGPNGQTTTVHLRVSSHGQDRTHFGGAEWKAFVVENGFKVGHQLVFSLVSMATFTVGLLELNSASPAPINKHSTSVEQRFNIPNSSTRTEMRGSTRPSGNVKNDVVYTNGTLKYKPDVEALFENLQCPHFVTVMGRSNVRDYRSSALCVPVKFLEKYGKYFTEVHFLRGPSGGSVEVRFSPGTKVGRFTTGWKAFHKENSIRLGDVLLFSLKAPARWLVQVVENGRSEDPGIGELCNQSDLD